MAKERTVMMASNIEYNQIIGNHPAIYVEQYNRTIDRFVISTSSFCKNYNGETVLDIKSEEKYAVAYNARDCFTRATTSFFRAMINIMIDKIIDFCDNKTIKKYYSKSEEIDYNYPNRTRNSLYYSVFKPYLTQLESYINVKGDIMVTNDTIPLIVSNIIEPILTSIMDIYSEEEHTKEEICAIQESINALYVEIGGFMCMTLRIMVKNSIALIGALKFLGVDPLATENKKDTVPCPVCL